MSSAGAITVLIGNPTRNVGFFWRCHQLEHQRWYTMKVSAFDSPRVSPIWIEEMRDRYGDQSNAYRIRVLADFPRTDEDTLIAADVVDEAMRRDVPIDMTTPELWGVDCARFGSDASVLIKRRGYVVTEMPRRWYGFSTMEVAGAVKAEYDLAIHNKPTLIVIDSIGIGAGVVDRLHEQGLPILGINVGETPSNKQHYVRLRDELWGRLKEWLGTRRVRLPKDDKLRDDLLAPKYSFSSDGRLLVESKDKMRSRGQPSPDSADALMLTLAEQGLMTTSEGGSGLFDAAPVMGAIAGMEV